MAGGGVATVVWAAVSSVVWAGSRFPFWAGSRFLARAGTEVSPVSGVAASTQERTNWRCASVSSRVAPRAACSPGVRATEAYFRAETCRGGRIPCCSNRSVATISSGVSVATMRPRSINTMRSTGQANTSSRRCSTMTMVFPKSRFSRSISSIVRRPAAGSSIARGSSNSKISTSFTSTPAIATRCFWPPESSWGA